MDINNIYIMFKPKNNVEEIVDPSAWMLDNSLSQFLLMPTSGIMYMCLFVYAFVHGELSFCSTYRKRYDVINL